MDVNKGRVAKNGNLEWHLPLGVRPSPPPSIFLGVEQNQKQRLPVDLVLAPIKKKIKWSLSLIQSLNDIFSKTIWFMSKYPVLSEIGVQ